MQTHCLNSYKKSEKEVANQKIENAYLLMKNATPDAYEQARINYYTLKEGQGWIRSEKERIITNEIDPFLNQLSTEFKELSSGTYIDDKPNEIGDESESRYLKKLLMKEKDKVSIRNRLLVLGGSNDNNTSWIPLILDILIGVLGLSIIYFLISERLENIFRSLFEKFEITGTSSEILLFSEIKLGLGYLIFAIACSFIIVSFFEIITMITIPKQKILLATGLLLLVLLFFETKEIVTMLYYSKNAFITIGILTILLIGEFILFNNIIVQNISKEDHIMTAAAIGYSNQKIFKDHIIRNSFFPFATRIAINLPYTVASLVIVESTTGWGGMGSMLYRAIMSQDSNAAMAILFLLAIPHSSKQFTSAMHLHNGRPTNLVFLVFYMDQNARFPIFAARRGLHFFPMLGHVLHTQQRAQFAWASEMFWLLTTFFLPTPQCKLHVRLC